MIVIKAMRRGKNWEPWRRWAPSYPGNRSPHPSVIFERNLLAFIQAMPAFSPVTVDVTSLRLGGRERKRCPCRRNSHKQARFARVPKQLQPLLVCSARLCDGHTDRRCNYDNRSSIFLSIENMLTRVSSCLHNANAASDIFWIRPLFQFNSLIWFLVVSFSSN